jgi:hypothetical protein
MSLFITFEGGEGCGKSSQARALYRRLSRLAIPAVLTHEPGGTPLGSKIGRWLKWEKADLSPLTELLLFNASRAQLVAEVQGLPAKEAENRTALRGRIPPFTRGCGTVTSKWQLITPSAGWWWMPASLNGE